MSCYLQKIEYLDSYISPLNLNKTHNLYFFYAFKEMSSQTFVLIFSYLSTVVIGYLLIKS